MTDLGCDGASVPSPFEVVATFGAPAFREPSGLIFHPERQTLFVVGDEGDLGEFNLEGTLLRQKRLMNQSFEGLTLNPVTGVLYIAIEGLERILEVDPESFELRRTFDVKRTYQGQTVLKKNNQGFEGITFVPNTAHPEGGTFWVTNQALDNSDPEDLSGLFEVVAQLSQPNERVATIQSSLLFDHFDLSGLYYDPRSQHLLVISDQEDIFFEVTLAGQIIATHSLPGDTQEGIAMDTDGYYYLAQDRGGLLKLRLNP